LSPFLRFFIFGGTFFSSMLGAERTRKPPLKVYTDRFYTNLVDWEFSGDCYSFVVSSSDLLFSHRGTQIRLY